MFGIFFCEMEKNQEKKSKEKKEKSKEKKEKSKEKILKIFVFFL
jgi:hypothetical protein